MRCSRFDRGRRDGSIPGEGRLGEGDAGEDAFDDEDTRRTPGPSRVTPMALRGREEGDKRGG